MGREEPIAVIEAMLERDPDLVKALAGSLGRARGIYRRLGEDGLRRSCIAQLRAQYPRHSALQAELDKAGM